MRGEGLDPTSLHWENFLVAEQDGQIVGIGQIKPYPSGPELGSLVVLAAYRGQGIAAQIIGALSASAPRPLYLMCLDKLESFYARYGFQRITRAEVPPGPIRLKLTLATPFRLVGLRVIVMRRDD
ncbi:MAG: GNAT family N-acetyltransferase [Chloroflexi bacterium]|nr:GNAT family N-acetyltransferase [Chloroflexota bacterium]